MPDFFPPTLGEQIQAVDRELKLRERMYPRWISAGKLSERKAEHELRCMRGVLDTLVALRDQAEPNTPAAVRA